MVLVLNERGQRNGLSAKGGGMEKHYIFHAGFGNKPWAKGLQGFDSEAEAMRELHKHNSPRNLLVCRGPYTAERFAALNEVNGWRVVDGQVVAFDRYAKPAKPEPEFCDECGDSLADCKCDDGEGEGCEVCGCFPCSCEDEPCEGCGALVCECEPDNFGVVADAAEVMADLFGNTGRGRPSLIGSQLSLF